jgi:hypothetical protein
MAAVHDADTAKRAIADAVTHNVVSNQRDAYRRCGLDNCLSG